MIQTGWFISTNQITADELWENMEHDKLWSINRKSLNSSFNCKAHLIKFNHEYRVVDKKKYILIKWRVRDSRMSATPDYIFTIFTQI